jgi:transposase
MNKFLSELSSVVESGRHVALIVDNAGWHTAKKLVVPDNITLIPLPPYAPELNAMEQIWEWIKNHFLSNQYYGVYEDIVTMACYAWNQLSKDVNLVKSIMYRDWINTPC